MPEITLGDVQTLLDNLENLETKLESVVLTGPRQAEDLLVCTRNMLRALDDFTEVC